MQYGIVFVNTGRFSKPDRAVLLAQHAEENGFDSLWAADHVVIPATYGSPYPYSSDGQMPWPNRVRLPDPLVWLAYVAARTTTVKLATGILILPQRNPVVLAKQAATLDVLSGGRLMLGVGTGWLEEESEAVGIPFAERGARLEEHIEVMRTLWRNEQASFHGRFTNFDDVILSPRPVNVEGIPIVIGGHSMRAARRAGTIGDGFYPAKITLEELTPLLATMRRAAEEAGRDPDAIEVSAGGVLDPDGVRQFRDGGVTRLLVPAIAQNDDGLKATLESFANQVIAKVD